MKSQLLDLSRFFPLVAFNCILGIILLVAGFLLLAASVQESLR